MRLGRKSKTDFQKWETFLASQHIQFVVVEWNGLPSARQKVIKLVGEKQILCTYGAEVVFTVDDKFLYIGDARND